MRRTNTRRFTILLALLTATGIVTSAAASAQDERFWQELQRSDGVSYFRPLPRGTASLPRESPQSERQRLESDWFAIERQKSDGHVADVKAPHIERASSPKKERAALSKDER